MKLQTAKALLKYAKQYMDLTGLKVGVATGWCYLPEYKAICIMEDEDYDEDERKFESWFIGYVKENFNINLTKDTVEIFSLYHELGHHMNGWVDDPEVYRYLVNEVNESDYYDYRQIPDERRADEFAASFIKEHYDELVEIYNKKESL